MGQGRRHSQRKGRFSMDSFVRAELLEPHPHLLQRQPAPCVWLNTATHLLPPSGARVLGITTLLIITF